MQVGILALAVAAVVGVFYLFSRLRRPRSDGDFVPAHSSCSQVESQDQPYQTVSRKWLETTAAEEGKRGS